MGQTGRNQETCAHAPVQTHFCNLESFYGAELYTVSKLIGHKKLDTTQIYAKVIDEKKRQAVDALPQL